jgi:Uma2 family endonuclease
VVGIEPVGETAREIDGRVVMHGLSWSQLESMLAIRGDQAGVRLAYLEGDLEILSPSRTHERIKTMIARLLEAYAEEAGVRLDGYGSETMKNPARGRAAEPDECYVVGEGAEPNLVIEVIWTSGGLDKRALYAGLGVAEFWEWQGGTLRVFKLDDGAYVSVERSVLLPELDLGLLGGFVTATDQTAAVRAFRRALRGGDTTPG